MKIKLVEKKVFDERLDISLAIQKGKKSLTLLLWPGVLPVNRCVAEAHARDLAEWINTYTMETCEVVAKGKS